MRMSPQWQMRLAGDISYLACLPINTRTTVHVGEIKLIGVRTIYAGRHRRRTKLHLWRTVETSYWSMYGFLFAVRLCLLLAQRYRAICDRITKCRLRWIVSMCVGRRNGQRWGECRCACSRCRRRRRCGQINRTILFDWRTAFGSTVTIHITF